MGSSLECDRSWVQVLVKTKTMKLVFGASLLLKHAALRRNGKDGLTQNQDSLS
jgi:hypothetical protein